jgi:hypothetical protein
MVPYVLTLGVFFRLQPILKYVALLANERYVRNSNFEPIRVYIESRRLLEYLSNM